MTSFDTTKPGPGDGELRPNEAILRTALAIARMNAFEFDLQTDRVVRLGQTSNVQGVTFEELGTTGTKYFTLVHDDDREKLRRAIDTLTPEHPEYILDYRIRADDGTFRWVQDAARGEFTSEGKLVRIRGVTMDVSERREAEDQRGRAFEELRLAEERARLVGEQAEVGYWYWDLRSNRHFWSAVFCHLADISPGEDPTCERFFVAVHPGDRRRLNDEVRKLLASGSAGELAIEYRLVMRDGRVRWVHSKGAATFENGEAVRMAGIIMDITRRKQLEQEREELLARERHLREQADEANIAKDHFLALLSHELRTPLTTILGWATYLNSGLAAPESTALGLESIEQASLTQARLIDDLLDVSRIISGKMVIEMAIVDVAEVVRHAIDVITPEARSRSINIIADLGRVPAIVRGDATRLQQVVWNLLANAVKFTSPGGGVEIEIREAETVEITIRDDGQGIDPAMLPHVFDRFWQADAGPSRPYGGLGLGLSIVRHLAELHGGSVRADSEGRGKGAEFVLTLPRAVERPALATDDVDNDIAFGSNALNGIRILVVDDDEGARQIIGTMLAGFGANVTRAASAAEALDSVAIVRPDVIVSDIGMPGADGYSLIRDIRTSPSSETARLPAVALTAYADLRDRDRALTAGYQEHVAKPVDPKTLARSVIRVLRSRG